MKSAEIIDNFISHFGINKVTHTKPAMLKEILASEFKLDTHKPLVDFLDKRNGEPVDVVGFVNKIKQGLIDLHPAIVEFLDQAMAHKLLDKEQLHETLIERSINRMYLHNEILIFGDENHKEESALIKHMLDKRRKVGVRSNSFLSWFDMYSVFKHEKAWYKRFFWVVKVKSVDLVIKIMFSNRIESSEMKKLNVFQRIFAIGALKVNILEAVVCDIASGNFRNALAGLALIFVLPRNVRARGTDLSKIEFGYNQQWSSLYHTWNLAYVTGTGVHFINHKLLQPMVNNKKTNRYMHTRVIALNNSLNFMLYNGDKESVFSPLKNISKLMKVWGDINLKYAYKFLKYSYSFSKKEDKVILEVH